MRKIIMMVLSVLAVLMFLVGCSTGEAVSADGSPYFSNCVDSDGKDGYGVEGYITFDGIKLHDFCTSVPPDGTLEEDYSIDKRYIVEYSCGKNSNGYFLVSDKVDCVAEGYTHCELRACVNAPAKAEPGPEPEVETCSDGTEYNQCSDDKPFYCEKDGTLGKLCSECGCPSGEECDDSSNSCVEVADQQQVQQQSEPEEICSDGTEYNQCSDDKPYYCDKTGKLGRLCRTCGCPSGEECDDGSCVEVADQQGQQVQTQDSGQEQEEDDTEPQAPPSLPEADQEEEQEQDEADTVPQLPPALPDSGQGGTPIGSGTTPTPTTPPAPDPASLCGGCLTDVESCVPIGMRYNNDFCDVSRQMTPQKYDGDSCVNDFECHSYLCIDNECSSIGLVRKLIRFFRSLFAGGI